MATHGVDVSKFQSTKDIDGWSFAIINAEDPTVGDKVAHCSSLAIPWGIYTWIYPGSGHADMTRATDCASKVGTPPLGFWLDYEQDGVSPADLHAALGAASELGVLERTGIYTYLYLIDSVAAHLEDRPLWLAYYPGNNDGSFPEDKAADARARGAVMWQYTSGANAPVGLDRNVVIDDDWYHRWTGAKKRGDDDLTPDQAKQLQEIHTALLGDLFTRGVKATGDHTNAYLTGIPGAIPPVEDRIKSGTAATTDVDAKAVAAAISSQLGPDLAKQVLEALQAQLGG